MPGLVDPLPLGEREVQRACSCRATIPPRHEHYTPTRELDGHLVELGDAWTLRKGTKVARCVLVRHQLGWESRLMVGELLRSQVCRSSEEIWSTQESWKAAMMTKGWHV